MTGTRVPRNHSQPVSRLDVRWRRVTTSQEIPNSVRPASVQAVATLMRRTGHKRLVMAGGCALNSVANGRMISEGYVDQAYFQPAASESSRIMGS